MPNDAGDIARMLGARARALAMELLPHGHIEGHEWRAGSVAGEPGQSLAVHVAGPKGGLWADFATGETGDALDLVAAARCRGDKRAAIGWARSWLGLGTDPLPVQRRAPIPPDQPDQDTEARKGAALRLFLGAAPTLAGTPAAAYLAARGIDLSELGRQPASLRFHPNLHNRESGRAWPALVAAVTNAAGDMSAVHRTWLATDAAGVWRKAPLRDPKMSLGTVTGGTIRLWRGASRKPLAQAPEGDAILIAEGIETALSCAIVCPELRVVSAVSLGNLAKVALPPSVRTVIIAADNDGDNMGAAAAVQRAADRFIAEGRAVRIARSPIGKDFNDCITADETS